MTTLKLGLLATTLAVPLFLSSAVARADDTPSTAEVLEKLHGANQTEIAMGKAAEKEGKSKAVKELGKMLVKDHAAADKKTVALAKQEKLSLPKAEPAMSPPPAGDAFDMQFAQMMVDAHKKDIAALSEARDKTADDNLKKLLGELLPTLQKHEEAAQKIVDAGGSAHAER